MQRNPSAWIIAVTVLAVVACEGLTMAQDQARKTSAVESGSPPSFFLPSLANAYNVDLGFRDSNLFLQQSDTPDGIVKSHDYREISDFFNVREANVNTVANEWELELEGEWVTGTGGDDDFEFTPNLKYGLNDDMFI